ncbi:LytTR family DNA-binding domain-containing protein [Labilibaculum sp.]|uniref:LytR/AlgR family response regulator transcription factor n=1 Tax=Labilibaculum sp. TaxID=2060723 RepID=UPI002AA67717|nr:LytTR family DNA-binding domain-containing protein [Labilibaculum sp.]
MIIESIILDRDLPHIESLKKYGESIPYLNIKACFSDLNQAKTYINENKTDLIFMDLEFAQQQKIDWSEFNIQKPEVIISMRCASYKYKDHYLSAFEYIMKPVSFEKFIQILNNIYIQKQGKTEHPKPEIKKNDFFFVKNNSLIEKVKFNEVLFFKGMKDYIWIQTINKKIITLQTMKNLSIYLPADRFLRIHKSYIVSLEHIDIIDKNRVVIGQERIPIGDTFRSSFFKSLKEQELIWD